ncbi:MAG TPA: type II toxin-antitoxin system VapC family toxin [Candidatus Latescibacteria bacterium]|nr:PIN domain nuclease [Gemmatimonadaceae bacterium]MDP6019375.1 type II toxin-antitoxin system VapC family toxin [Candidatus Latescibacterota bacterium]HJP31032.1 type II toxin-antitoxin system VapC family toxin [Candidatus Latescibacterota bacterium]
MLLDTCALLWLGQGGGRLSPKALQQIDDAPIVFVSAISGFEIGVKVAKGKLSLPCRPAEWLAAVLAHHDLRELPVDLAVSVRSTELPTIHSDPVDRILIATAESKGLPVVTADAVFARYGIEVLS